MYSEAEMRYEEMQRVVKEGYLCAQCQSILTIAWGGSYGINSYVLRCGRDATHTGITRHDKKYEQKLKEGFSMESNKLMTMDEAKMIQRVEMARFPQDLTVADKRLLAQIAITYGLDPLMREVTIYQGSPFVSIDGRYRKAQETGRLDGVETRPTTEKERKDWQIPEGDYFFRAEVYVTNASHAFVGWGRVRQSETIGGKGFKPVETNPQRMAEKRAEAQALRKAFHIPLPSVEDIGSPDFDIASMAVDVTTGEITEPEPSPRTPSSTSEKSKPEASEEESDTLPEDEKEAPEMPSDIDFNWLKETLGFIHWSESTAKSWLRSQFRLYPNLTQKAVLDLSLNKVFSDCTPEQRRMFTEHINSMRESAGK